jgi:ribosome maturation factor RimP
MKNITGEIELLIKPMLDTNKIELVDIEYKHENGNYVLRVFLDKETGITLKDCELYSDRIGTLLDEKDLIKDSYSLEISSPGLNRVLKKETDYVRFINKKICVKLYEPVTSAGNKPQKNFVGYIRNFENGLLKLELDKTVYVQLPFTKIASARLEPDLEI